MADIPASAVDAAEATLRAYLEPWLTYEVFGTTLASQLRTAAAIALRDAEKTWPHDTAKRDPASTTAASTERARPFDFDRRRPASFGFGKDITA